MTFNCPTCGYDLTGLTRSRCPECGGEFDLRELARLANASGSPGLGVMGTLVGMIGIMILGPISISSGVPQIHSPFPMTLIIPMFLLEGGDFFPVVLLCGLFLLWNIPLMRGQRRVGWWSTGAFGLLSILNLAWFVLDWSFSVGYHGLAFTVGVTIMNVVAVSILIVMWELNRRTHTQVTNLVFHVGVGWWLAFCAFPYLGELP